MVPTPEQVFEDLSSVLPHVYSALDRGTYKALEYLENENKRGRVGTDDRCLASSIVRYHAKIELVNLGELVGDDEEVDSVLKYAPNIGLHISHGRYNIRILKSDNGNLPVPGQSLKRRNFYQQITMDFSSPGGKDQSPVNLIILWDVSYPYHLSGLSLACPMGGDFTRESVVAHWVRLIPQSILSGNRKIVAPSASIEVEDLPITPRAKTVTGTGSEKK